MTQQSFATYVCEQSFEPSWLQQRFVFDIPSEAVKDHRGLNLRIQVKAKSMVGLDAVLAKLDVPFSCLR